MRGLSVAQKSMFSLGRRLRLKGFGGGSRSARCGPHRVKAPLAFSELIDERVGVISLPVEPVVVEDGYLF
jgi:hypothetical protein